MNKAFKTYALIWAIILIVFNVICFVTPSEIGGVSKYNGGFWTGYIFITLAFIGQLYCSNIAFKADNLKRLFYSIPLISISYTGLIIMLIAGGITMAVSIIPTWVGIIVCVVIFAFTAVAVIKASAAAEVVEKIDDKIKTQTYFVRSITADAESLYNNTSDETTRAECKKVYEALRYSDPMTSEELAEIEEMIKSEFSRFKDQVYSGDVDTVQKSKEKLIDLINTRNTKCKMLK